MSQLGFSNPELVLHGRTPLPTDVLEFTDIFIWVKSKFSSLALIKVLGLVVKSTPVMLKHLTGDCSGGKL